MNFSDLIQPLEDLSKKSLLHPQLDYLNPDSGRYKQIAHQWVNDTDGLIEKITEIMTSIPEMKNYQVGSIRRSPSGTASFRLTEIARWALAQSRVRPSLEVVNQLQEFVSLNSVPMSEVLVIWGLNPILPIQLTEHISLIPLNSLNPSDPMDQLTGIRAAFHPVGTSFPHPRPTAALKWDFIHTPILSATLSLNSPSKMEEMKEIVKCLCLIDNTPVCEIASWYECEPTTPIIGGVLGWNGQATEHIFHTLIQAKEYNQGLVQSIVQKFMSLTPEDRRRFYIPLNRLNTALRRNDSSDIALELGIALEGLLDPGDTDIAYKVRQRGTYLLGGTAQEKKERFEKLKRLYDIRSRVAHGSEPKSTVKINGVEVQTSRFLKDSTIMCAELTRVILVSGFILDWDGVILGW